MTTIVLQMLFTFTSAVVPSQLILINQYTYLLLVCEVPTWTQGLHKAYSIHECLTVSAHEPAGIDLGHVPTGEASSIAP